MSRTEILVEPLRGEVTWRWHFFVILSNSHASAKNRSKSACTADSIVQLILSQFTPRELSDIGDSGSGQPPSTVIFLAWNAQ